MDPTMSGGLSRSNSGNFVLTGFEASIIKDGLKKPVPLIIRISQATFEQGS